MVLLRTYIILGFVSLCKSQENYCISNHTASARNASKLCRLATPTYHSDGVKYIVNLQINSNDPLWVGYEETTFTYRGCTQTNRLSNIKMKVPDLPKANPFICYRHCKTTFIGIANKNSQKKPCVCIISLDVQVLNNVTCTSVCDFPNNIQCGGNNEVSVYETVKSPTTDDNPVLPRTLPEHCLGYEPTSQHFFWADCNTTLQSVCVNDSMGLIPLTDGYADWTTAMTNCIKQDLWPASVSANFSNLQKGQGQYWTGTIRSFGRYRASDETMDSSSDMGYIRQGFILCTSTSNYQYELRFGLNRSATALCQSACFQPNASSSTSIPTESTSNPDGHSTVTRDSSTNGSTSAGNKPSSTTGPFIPRDDKHSKTAEVGVYVAVPLILILVAAVVVGFVLWRIRKRQLCNKSKGNGAAVNGSNQNDCTGVSMSNAAYQDECRFVTKEATTKHDYFVLEPTNEYAVISEGDIEKEGENDYDTTEKKHTKGANVPNKSSNIYNRLDAVTEDPYNHTNAEFDTSDDTYNHMEISSPKRFQDKPTDMTMKPNSSPNDTYSHLEGNDKGGNCSLKKLNSPITNNVEDTYNHADVHNSESQNNFFKSKNIAQTLNNQSDPKRHNGKPSYDYAYATKASQNVSSKPSKFTFGSKPTLCDYELAKEPKPAPGYEFAKPTPEYLELSND